MSKSREQLYRWLGGIQVEGGCLLDLGVQDKPVESKLAKCDVDCYRTLDIDPQWLPDYLVDLNTQELSDFTKGKMFDHVFALEVFEHLWNPLFALESIRNCMSLGGKLYMSWPFINPMHDQFDFARYTAEGMTKLLSETDFKVIKLDYRRATVGQSMLETFFSSEGMKVSKIRPPFDHQNKDIIGYMLIAEAI